MSVKVKPTLLISEIASSVFIEYIPKDILAIIIKNYQEIEGQITETRLKQIKEKNNNYSLLAILKKLYKNVNESNKNNVTYSHSKNLKNKGRLFADSPSLQGLPREIRGLLAKSNYIDVDIKNCHFIEAYQYCNK